MKKSYSSWYVATFLIVIIAALFLFSSHFMEKDHLHIRAYAVTFESSLQEHSLNAINLVNKILNIGAKVFWIVEPISVMTINKSEYLLNEGSFIIPNYQPLKRYGVQSSISFYIERLVDESNATVLRMSYLPKVAAYPLTSFKVAVYYGGAVTGEALWQIHALEKAGFNIDVITEAGIQSGSLIDYDLIMFPGGGFYMNYLNSTGIEEIKSFVENGGGFVGECGGLVLGVQIGLLNAQLAYSMESPPEKHVNLRGTVILESTSPTHPLTFGPAKFFESDYVLGPFINEAGNDVTVVARYHASTSDMQIYFPEVFEAYNYTSQTDGEFLDNFLGTPAIIAGNYGKGKIVLSTTHLENLPESRRVFINSIYFLSSKEKVPVISVSDDDVAYLFSLNEEAVFEWNETHYNYIRCLIEEVMKRSSNAKSTLESVNEEDNKNMIGFTAEYYELFLSDIHSRVIKLQSDLSELKDAYGKLELIKQSSRFPIVPEMFLDHIDNLQSRTCSILQLMVQLNELIQLMDVANDELLSITATIDHILSTDLSEKERFQELINLQVMEGSALHRLKDNITIHLLRFSFEIGVTLTNIDFSLSLIN